MTNAFCLVGSYIMVGTMCLCLTNRICVLKQPGMARVMTNCINKTFITLNILATKSQLPLSTSEHPAPLTHSYSSHTMTAMHKLAFFCHIGGLVGLRISSVCFACDETGCTDGRWLQNFFTDKSINIFTLCASVHMCLCLGMFFVYTFHTCMLFICVCMCIHVDSCPDWLMYLSCAVPGLYCCAVSSPQSLDHH